MIMIAKQDENEKRVISTENFISNLTFNLALNIEFTSGLVSWYIFRNSS